MVRDKIFIGTAGWTIPRAVAEQFPSEGSGLQRYAARFAGCEINTSFYRSHRPDTWTRWRDATPTGFRCAVKVPRAITHDARLVDTEGRLASFLDEARLLEDKLGPLLVQLPPTLAFDPVIAGGFFGDVRRLWSGPTACEPRHASWWTPSAQVLLQEHEIACVAADPARHAGAELPSGWAGLAYWRLHGSPRMYYSAYGAERIAALAQAIRASGAGQIWCIFDNTASGAAAADALALQALLQGLVAGAQRTR
jgi:uncharacterized protein YecE (DUF72 family)